ncbi:MAG: hypothetical protein A2Z20_01340 [Bdellovibrionales bacterium RBG_16_40_8]|nr:MAG: hypothetical protein A2Z20_01340 [Bdellovibrionales bacterium RBG_16_40_8]
MSNFNLSLNVVLVRPNYPRNVGSVSRALANMGAARLILIQPSCEINLEARQGAAGAQTHLLERTCYDSWDSFFANEREGIRIAFCAREKKETDTLDLSSRLQKLNNIGALSTQPLYLIFGPENHGLKNSDVEYANFICQLPIFGTFKSMNLSHAVMLALYVVQSTIAQITFSTSENIASTAMLHCERFEFPAEAIKDWLSKLGFEFGDRRTDAYKVIKRILLNNLASSKELRILEAVIHQTIRKLPTTNNLDQERN